MESAENPLSENARRVYEYVMKVQEATKKRIITDVPLRGEEDYLVVRNELVNQGLAEAKMGRNGGLVALPTRRARESQEGHAAALYLEGKDKTTEELSEKARTLYSLIPPDGKPITNKKLQEEFQRKLGLKDMPVAEFLELFYKHKQELVDQDKIEKKQMRGGGVAVTEIAQVSKPSIFVRKEEDLYPFVEKYLKKEKVPELHGENWQVWVCDTSKANIPGRWSRPDITLVKTRHFDFAPGTEFVVTGYEVKQNRDKDNIVGVFEAASHSARCHECYLLVETSEDKALDYPPPELRRDLRRFGVGFCWLYRDKDGNYSFEETWPSIHHSPLLKDEHQLLEAMHDKLPQEERQSFKTAVQAARGAVG